MHQKQSAGKSGMHAVKSGMYAVESGMHAVESGMHAVESGMHAGESDMHTVESGMHAVRKEETCFDPTLVLFHNGPALNSRIYIFSAPPTGPFKFGNLRDVGDSFCH